MSKMILCVFFALLSFNSFAEQEPERKCRANINYERDTNIFRGNLLNLVLANQKAGKLLHCVQVDLVGSSSTITTHEYPTVFKEWFEAIQRSGGNVKTIAVDLSDPWWLRIVGVLFNVFFNYIDPNAREAAKEVNAEVYYDRHTDVVLYVKFLPR